MAEGALVMAVWLETIDLSKVWNHDDDWKVVRDNIIPIIKKSQWFSDSFQVQDLVEELEEALNVQEFDSIFNDLYDEADADRVWIETS